MRRQASAEFDIGSADNRVEIKITGELNLHGTGRVKQYLRVAAPSMRTGGGVPAEERESVFWTLDFDNLDDEIAYYTLSIPHFWDASVDVEFLVDWFYDGAGSPGTVEDAGTVCWGLEYNSIKAGEFVTGAGTSITKVSAGNHSSDKLVRTAFTDKLLVSNLEAGDILGLEIYRDVSEDTLAQDARLLAIYFCFTQNKLGEKTT